jgi:hypothetical protein
VGIIRKSMSITTAGLIDFRSDKERIARSARQNANATRRLVQIEERRDGAAGIAPLSGGLNSPFSGRTPSHPSAVEIAAATQTNDVLVAAAETQRLLREQNELLRRSMLTPEQRDAEDAANAAAEAVAAAAEVAAKVAAAEKAAIAAEMSDLRGSLAAGFAAWCRAHPRAAKLEFAKQQGYSLPKRGDTDGALRDHNRAYLSRLTLNQLRELAAPAVERGGTGTTGQLPPGSGDPNSERPQ